MASLFRNSRSIVARLSYITRTATTTTGSGTIALQNAGRKAAPVDAIRPKPAGEVPLIPLVGKSINGAGKVIFGVFLAISAYFVYINFVTNPEFHKSLALSREASKRDAEARIRATSRSDSGSH